MTNNELLSLLVKFYQDHNRSPMPSEIKQEKSITNRFGTLNAALKLVNLPLHPRPILRIKNKQQPNVVISNSTGEISNKNISIKIKKNVSSKIFKYVCTYCLKEYETKSRIKEETKNNYCSHKCFNLHRTIFTKENLIKILQDYYLQYGEAPVSTEFKHTTTIIKLFGTWNNALKEANIPLNFIGKIESSKITDWNDFSWERKRKIVLLEQNYECRQCGISSWENDHHDYKLIILEVNHINGDSKDHTRENLEALCPNCHSCTETWTGRNKNRKSFSDEELIKALIITKNIHQSAQLLKAVPGKYYYNRCRKLLKEMEPGGRLELPSMEYKTIESRSILTGPIF